MGMTKIAMALFLIFLFITCFAGAEESINDGADRDWMGVWPIYSYGNFISPYYQYYPYYTYDSPAYSYTPPRYSTWPKYSETFWYYPRSYAEPYYYYQPYFAWKYPTSVWWIGTHGDLPKTLDIARSSSSVRVYYNGYWQTP
ncbi:MAG: hypothetical protein JW999_00970 [Methanotrichaceae archaeon]|nr:hypothetical protein [Methanotrichaceae archaeon]